VPKGATTIRGARVTFKNVLQAELEGLKRCE
jgi:hypothetical protein